MIPFDDSDAVEEWLDGLDYESFWQEIAIYRVGLPDREACEDDIARGVARETVLFVLKGFARLQIVADQNLKPRITIPFMRVH